MGEAAACRKDSEEATTTLKAQIEKIRKEFEQEICLDVGDLEYHLRLRRETCTKNPGHEDFIPIKDLDPTCLPPEWRDSWVCHKIKQFSRHVVHLSVAYTSLDRPEGYCGHELRGSSCIRTGTGIAIVEEDDLLKELQDCPFKDCKEARGDHKVTPYFEVHTAAHVVCNTSEALKTRATFFLDSEEDRQKGFLLEAQGVRCSGFNLFGDVSIMICVSHDHELFRHLLSNQKQEREEFFRDPTFEDSAREPLIVIPSHPHGYTKHVGLGTLRDLKGGGMKEVYRDMGGFPVTSILSGFPINQILHQKYGTGLKFSHVVSCDTFSSFASSFLSQVQHFMLQMNPDDVTNPVPNFVETFYKTMNPCRPVPKVSGDDLRKAQQLLHSRGADNLVPKPLLYSTPTCPGSSGAPVFVFYERKGFLYGELVSVHSGTRGKWNLSGVCNVSNIPLHRTAGPSHSMRKADKVATDTATDIELD